MNHEFGIIDIDELINGYCFESNIKGVVEFSSPIVPPSNKDNDICFSPMFAQDSHLCREKKTIGFRSHAQLTWI